jgi:hypothetical protein
MNNRSWTGDKYALAERIECEIIITITEELSTDRFKANINIQSNRPVYNSDYKTVMFNYVDKDFEITYREYEALDFNENTFQSNLTSVLAYYAYIVIGFDYDSFEMNGGTAHFLKAQQIVNNSQNAKEKGWKPFDGLRNRYWLVENMLDAKFKDYRRMLYDYHRKALDKMYDDPSSSVKTVSSGLELLSKVNSSKPNSMALQLFFVAKVDELVGMFKNAGPTDKTKAVALLTKMDAANAGRYRGILTGK